VTPERRFEGLALADAGELVGLADRILASGVAVEVIRGPVVARGPLRLPLPDVGTVVAGHAVLTTCAVTLAGVRGDGTRAGDAPEPALAAAICDAEAERAGALAKEVHRVAAASLDARASRRLVRGSMIERTRLREDA